MVSRKSKTQPKDTGPFVDSATLARGDHPRHWLVDEIFLDGQPAILAGPPKAFKTTMAIDLAISIGSGQPFLGRFPVRKPRRVAMMSGQDGYRVLQDSAKRICEARKVNLEQDCDVLWSAKLPNLSDEAGRQAFGQVLQASKVEVVIVDPLYGCLVEVEAADTTPNLYRVGALLEKAARACLDAGAMPVFIHRCLHSAFIRTRNGQLALRIDEPFLAGVGVAELARQWLLISPDRPYSETRGCLDVWITAGSNAGHMGSWRLCIRDRQQDPRDRFHRLRRTWQISEMDTKTRRKPPYNWGRPRSAEPREDAGSEYEDDACEAEFDNQ